MHNCRKGASPAVFYTLVKIIAYIRYRVHTIIVIRCLGRMVVVFYETYLLLAFLCDIITRNTVYTIGKVYVYAAVLSHVYNIPSASGDVPFRSNLYACNNNKKNREVC